MAQPTIMWIYQCMVMDIYYVRITACLFHRGYTHQVLLVPFVLLAICSVVSVGQAFFTPTRSTTASLGDGREVWFGYRQTARPSMWKTVLLNIDSKFFLYVL